MRRVISIVVAFLACAVTVTAGYDYIVSDGEFVESIGLTNSESLWMTGGGIDHLTVFDHSQALIQDTSPLVEFSGGIWMLTAGGYSQLEFSGGGIHEFTIGSYATATFSGGRIDEIRSYQSAYTHAGWPDPHITFVCDVGSVAHDTQTNILTGDWLGGTGFEIQLVNVDGYSPVIENMLFIPEPASLLLVVVGMAFMRKRR